MFQEVEKQCYELRGRLQFITLWVGTCEFYVKL